MNRLNDVFLIDSTLFENNATVIYRAMRKQSGEKVILKTHKNPEDIHKIRHEFNLLKDRNISGIANVLDIFNNNEDPVFLVSEDQDAIVFEDYLKNNEIDENSFLHIAENAANSLASIHDAQIIHRDIKPANMLINPDTLEIWYFDFGISLQVTRGYDVWQESAAGTLEYLSPEQTGRISKTIDFRSDIYSLGVTFYRLATGRMPFTGKNAMELIHAHIAVMPVPPGEIANIQSIVSRGIMKMLKKKPENRYQTAASLAYDVRRCRMLVEEGKDCNSFMLGEKDIFYNLEPGRKLYGKDNEFKELKNIFERIDNNGTELVLLEGSNTSGKSMLLNAIERHATYNNALVFRAEYTQLEQSEPYYALRNAFAAFESLVYGSKISLASYRDRILERLGENAQVLIDILPHMERVLGTQAKAPKLNPAESQIRRKQVFRSFMRILCEAPCPCVFIFDNAQWADETSLELIRAALEDRNLFNSMIIFAYRIDEPGVSERFRDSFSRFNPQHNRLSVIRLQPLSVEDTAFVIYDIFPQDKERALELAKIAYEYSEGNLRRLEAYLKDLFHSGAINYDEASGLWSWKREAVGPTGAQSISEQIDEIYLMLSPQTIYCLDILAVIGVPANEWMYGIGLGNTLPIEDGIRELRSVMSIGIVAFNEENKSYDFASPSTRQAAYAHIDEETRLNLHEQVGKNLYEYFLNDEEGMISHCYAITLHFNKCGAERLDEEARRRIVRLNRAAADSAMAASNIERAAKFYVNAVSLEGYTTGDQFTEESFSLFLNYASCQFLQGDVKDADRIYRYILENVKTPEQRYEVYSQMVEGRLSNADWASVAGFAREYLKSSPLMHADDADVAALCVAEQARFEKNVQERDVDYFINAETCSDEALRRDGSMLALLAEAMIINMNHDARYYIYRCINLAYDNGVFPNFVKVLALLAERYANMGEFARAKLVFEWGLSYADVHNAPKSMLYAVYCSVISHWVEPLANVPQLYQRVKHVALTEGNLYYSVFADLMLLGYDLFTGVPLAQAMRDIDAAIYNAKKSGFMSFKLVFSSTFKQFVRCMTGRTRNTASFDDNLFREEDLNAEIDPMHLCYNAQFYNVYRAKALFTNGHYKKALQYLEKMNDEGLGTKTLSAFLCRAQYYYYYSLTLIRLCEEDNTLYEKYLPIIEENQKMMKLFADSCPDNFLMKYCLIEAEIARHRGASLAIVVTYGEIETSLRANNLIWDCAIIEELLVDFWQQHFLAQYRNMHLQSAFAHYEKLGARVKMMQLMGSAQMESDSASLSLSTTTILSTTGHSLSTDTVHSASLDYQAILHVISCMVSEDSMDEMIDQLVMLLMKNGGAEQALLFLLHDKEPYLHAFRYSERYTHGLVAAELPLPLSRVGDAVVPHRVVELCLDKGLRVVANSADNEFAFLGDPYMEAHRPESFICLPIVAKGRIIGAVYLENARLPGVFADDRVAFLNTVVLQSSLLIQNALEMHDLEGYTGELEKRLNSYINQLNTLIAGIAHEVNSPLGVCVTVASRLYERAKEVLTEFNERRLSKTAFDEYLRESHEGLDILTNNVSRASALVQNFKQIAVDQSNEVFEEVNLLDTLRNITEYIRPAVKKKIATCTVTGPEDLRFYTSTGVLAQIFTNLIMNSAIHGFNGYEKEDCHITVNVTQDAEEITITYSDNGRGMTQEERDQVFLPFYTTRRGEGGSGLGGHIILTLVTQTLHGAIHCVSAPEHGASFILRLPKNLESIQ